MGDVKEQENLSKQEFEWYKERNDEKVSENSANIKDLQEKYHKMDKRQELYDRDIKNINETLFETKKGLDGITSKLNWVIIAFLIERVVTFLMNINGGK